MIRIVGLSATLPNFLDVAHFLGVSPYEGLFVFDGRFRPVPLGQTFIGVKGTSSYQVANEMDKVCYDKVLDNVEKGHQVGCDFIISVNELGYLRDATHRSFPTSDSNCTQG